VVDCQDDRPESLVTVGDCRLDGGVQDLFHEGLGELGGTQPVRGLDGLAVDSCRQEDRGQLRDAGGGPQLLEQLQSIHEGHGHIEYRDLGWAP
jgi:hypothetical protein